MKHLFRFWITVCTLALAAACASPPPEQPATPIVSAQRGGDLYRDNCNACHTAQVHWREKRLVRSWDDLLFQVSRWQAIAGQGWSRDEIADVAAYLNGVFYDLPCPTSGCRGSGVTESAQRYFAGASLKRP
jgi:mono/diheme cytochrome c family protein